MITAIDWSHTKELTTFDGKKVRVEMKEALLRRLTKESMLVVESNNRLHFVVLEQGCPLSLIYYFTRYGISVKLISNRATEDYRKANSIEKSDETDARIIYELASNGASLQSIAMDDKLIQLHDIYHQYCRYQKARVAMQNMKKAHVRQYGTGESTLLIQSKPFLHPVPDLSSYDIAIDTLHAREKSLLKRLGETARGLPLFEMRGESAKLIESTEPFQPPKIKGLGQRLWLGILITANPTNFKCLSAYLRYCGLTEDTFKKTHKYSRHARMLYYMLAEQVLRQSDPKFRPVYDKCKADLAEKHPDYKKGHIHNAAMTRLSTFLAKGIFEYNHKQAHDTITKELGL